MNIPSLLTHPSKVSKIHKFLHDIRTGSLNDDGSFFLDCTRVWSKIITRDRAC